MAGLAAAHRVHELAPTAHLLLLEQSGRLGGVMTSEVREGFLLEGGPDAILSTKPAGVGLIRRVGLESLLVPTSSRSRETLVWKRGEFWPFPSGFTMLAPSKWSSLFTTKLLSVRGKLRLLKEPFLPPKRSPDEETVAEFVERRLGKEVLEGLVQPLVSAVFSAEPEELSLPATFPQFMDLERKYGSLFRGMRKDFGRPRESGARYSLFVTLKGGLEELTQRLKERLPKEAIHLGVRVERVSRVGGHLGLRAEGQSFFADAVILALPAPQAAGILAEEAPSLSEKLQKISYTSGCVVHFGFARKVPGLPKAMGFVVPRSERAPLLACSFSSQKFPHRAPKGGVLLRCFARSEVAQRLDDGELSAELFSFLQRALHLEVPPDLTACHRHPVALPQYGRGHLTLVSDIERELERLPLLFLAGNAYRGVGVPDVIRSGEEAAERALQALTEKVTLP